MKTNKITRYWIAVGIIWLGSVVMTYFNTETIAQIRINQESVESLHMEDVFLKKNIKKISHVLNQQARIYKPIDSIQLEMLTLKDTLKLLAQQQGLTEFSLSSDTTNVERNRIHLDMQVSGSYRDLVFLLKKFENDLPPIQATGMQMIPKKDDEGYRFRVMIDFRFSLLDTEDDNPI